MVYTAGTPFSLNPVLTGLTWFSLYYIKFALEMSHVDLDWHVMPVVHLFNAIKQRGHNLSWPGMEELIRLWGPQFLFGGGAPRKLKDCYAKIRVAKGLPPDQNISFEEYERLDKAKKRPVRQFCDNLKQGTVFNTVMDLWAGGRPFLSNPHRLQMLERYMVNSEKRGSNKVDQGIAPMALLDFFEHKFPDFVAKMSFDYVTLNRQCLKIKFALLDSYLDRTRQLPHLFGLGWDEREQLFDIVEDVLLLIYTEGHDGRPSKILAEVAEIIEEIL